MSSMASDFGYVVCANCDKIIRGLDVYWTNAVGKMVDEPKCVHCHSKEVRESLRMSVEDDCVSENGYREQIKPRGKNGKVK